jgi:RimJ/RimL family protein N-acetyltransferase
VHSCAPNPANARYTGRKSDTEDDTRKFLESVKPGADASAEVGWILHKDYRKQGYGTEFARALIRYRFEDLKLRRI